jgi:hypothetical protein
MAAQLAASQEGLSSVSKVLKSKLVWDVTPCGLTEVRRRFGETYCTGQTMIASHSDSMPFRFLGP